MNTKVQVFAPVNPTEVQEKVEQAILNFFPVSLELQGHALPMLYGEGDTTRFMLNKQVAFIGKLNFPAGMESLGSIDVEISADNEDELLTIIDWLAPRTEDGEPVMEIEL
jgi:predicted RNA binding protein with dsRBD fold (UPF0201 family)